MPELVITREWRDAKKDTFVVVFETQSDAETAQHMLSKITEPFHEDLFCISEIRP